MPQSSENHHREGRRGSWPEAHAPPLLHLHGEGYPYPQVQALFPAPAGLGCTHRQHVLHLCTQVQEEAGRRVCHCLGRGFWVHGLWSRRWEWEQVKPEEHQNRSKPGSEGGMWMTLTKGKRNGHGSLQKSVLEVLLLPEFHWPKSNSCGQAWHQWDRNITLLWGGGGRWGGPTS